MRLNNAQLNQLKKISSSITLSTKDQRVARAWRALRERDFIILEVKDIGTSDQMLFKATITSNGIKYLENENKRKGK